MGGLKNRDDARRRRAAEAVLAYVRDEDADILNITQTAVEDDPTSAALHLTALAGRAVTLLAECSGESVEAVIERLSRQ
ncbi:hypothetical protein [Sporichthya polymorpha]|uniref:hypothetical protein n=1 Tax=Sporichthya polymorpha TaxID=35751 RepID=UPI0003A8A690|nr:hypothetical protein [Sporichthya polymorpha]